MAKSSTKKLYNSFVRGLLTEAGPLTFPDGAALDLDNMVLNRDGSLQRRLGMDYDNNYVVSAAISNDEYEDRVVSTIEWYGAGGDSSNQFLLIQIGSKVYIHDMSGSTPAAVTHTVDLSIHQTTYAVDVGSNPVAGVAGKGYMFIVAKDIEPFYITYNGGTFEETPINMQTRDFLGAIDDSLGITGQDVLLDIWHDYNLRNQGWNPVNAIDYAIDGTNNPPPTNYYPDNTQVWSLAKNATDDFDVSKLIKLGVTIINFGNTRAPNGHYILSEFDKDRSTASGVVGIEKDTYKWRPTAVGFYASRVFYSGVEHEAIAHTGLGIKPATSLSGNIYFSQLLTEIALAGNCYQAADPTSENVSDLVDTDGGVIVLPESGKILKMIELQEYLVVIAENGIWSIRGGNDTGFVATSYIVEKVSTIRASNANTIVQVDTDIVVWAQSGIYSVTYNPQTVKVDVGNISEKTVQTYYDTIPEIAKRYATGVYDQISRKIRWLYNDTSNYDGTSSVNSYNRELILDTSLSAFSPNTISDLVTDSPKVIGFYNPPNLTNTTADINVVAGADTVEASGVQVVVSKTVPTNGDAGIKYIFKIPGTTTSQYTFGRYLNTGFKDWVTEDSTGITYDSFLITGHELVGDPTVIKQAPALLTFMNRTETQYIDDGSGNAVFDLPSDCTIQARWEWSTSSGTAARWSNPFSAYKLIQLPMASGVLPETIDFGYDVVTNKNVIRGRGRSLSLYFYSTEGKDMHIIGWSIDFTGATKT